jgi:nucleoside-diphosphate-sugar epimerase
MKFSKAVVTGSEGFIGGHLVDELLARGVKVLGIDDLSSGLESTLEAHLKHKNYISRPISIADQRVPLVLQKFKPDVVFHLAAKAGVANSIVDPVFTDFVNINGSINMLESARLSGVKRFVFSSSSSVYGGSRNLPTSESEPLNPKSPYALQKLTAENYCKLYSKIHNLDTISLRYFNVFGPRQRSDSDYAAVIAAFVNAEKSGVSPKIYGSGEQFRDFLYVKNAVYANILAANSKNEFFGEAINIGTGVSTTVNKLCDILCSRSPEYMEGRPGDVFCSRANIERAKELIGYCPKWSFEAGLSDTVAFTCL